MSLAVAFHHPHNEGRVAGVITGPGFDTGTSLVDTFEVDASIKSFDTEEEAIAWLVERVEDLTAEQLLPVVGGKMINWED